MVKMEREKDIESSLSFEKVNELEEKRIQSLNDAHIDEEEVLNRANQHLNTWNSYFQENITRGKDDLNFCLRDQWTAVERSEFTRLFKPCMTFNKMYDSTKKIVGEQRKNKPDLLVRSLTGKATQEQINLRADLVRTISYQSQNDLVYQTAFRSSLMMGHGAFQIGLDYESPKSFNRIVTYQAIPDPTVCSWDPTAIKPHKGDGNYCARRYVFTRDEFFATYPYITNPVSYVDPYMLLDFQWTTRDTIIVADYFVKEWFPVIIYKLSNGEVIYDWEWPDYQKIYKEMQSVTEGSEVRRIIDKEIPKIVHERQTQDYEIMHYRMTQNQIIDFSVWPSKQLPIPFVDGDSYWIEGRQYTKSFIHEARDAQKLLNYSRSETAAELKNRRREQWLATPDNILGQEQQWRNPELQQGALIARVDPKTGQLPQKMPAWDISQGLFATSQAATQDMREIMGFSENEEMQGRDISGKARRERKMEGSMSAYVFFDNLNQAIEQGGRVVNDLLDYIIGDEERQMVVAKKNGQTETIIINQRGKNPEEGIVANKLEAGDYDVEIDTGPAFAVQKEIALEFFQQTIANNPQVFNLIADLWAAQLDIQNMEQVKDRLKSLVPPEIIAKEEGKPPPPPQPNPQQQMMQAEMQFKQAEIQEKQAALKIKQEELELKKMQHQLDEAELMVKGEKIKMDAQLNVYDHQLNLEKTKLTHNHGHKKSDEDFAHKIAGILADLHKQEKQHSHERELSMKERKSDN
jgi:hypothetical protein